MIAYNTRLKLKKNPFKYGMLGLSLVVAGFLTVAIASQASTSPTSTKKNIVFILTDDQTYESLSRMPYTNGRSDWIRFDRAFVNDPLCCPSRTTILTGLYSSHTGVENNAGEAVSSFNPSSNSGVWLQSAGYRTGFLGKYLNGYPWNTPSKRYVPGWNEWAAVESAEGAGYYNYDLNVNGKVVHKGKKPEAYNTDVVTKKATDFIHNSGPPFFLQVNYKAPHTPYQVEPVYQNTFKNATLTKPPNFNEADVSDKPSWVRSKSLQNPIDMIENRRKQYQLLQSVDDGVEKIFTALKNNNKLSNTVVIFTSDHGYMNGEHRLKGKQCGYEECIHVPFLIRYPGQAGRTDHALVSNTDLAPTFAKVAGINPPNPVDGKNLIPVFTKSTPSVQDAILLRNKYFQYDPYQVPSYWGLRTEQYKYIEMEGTGERELYDIRVDPSELNNLANNPAYAATVTSLSAKLAAMKATPPQLMR